MSRSKFTWRRYSREIYFYLAILYHHQFMFLRRHFPGFFLIICLLQLNVQKVSAQSYSQLLFGIEDGLLHNRIDCMTQDSLDYIWISNGLGLTRYDGMHFTNFKPEEPFSNSSGIVTDLRSYPDGSLSYPVMGGITRFSKGQFSFSKIDSGAITNIRRGKRKFDNSSDGLFDRWGNLWVLTSALYKFDGNKTLQMSDKNLPPLKDFRQEFIDEKKNFWIVSKNGFHKFNGVSFETIKVVPDSNYSVYSAFEDQLHRTWFLAHPVNDFDNVELFLFDKGKIEKLYMPFREYGSFSGGIAEDDHGDVWLTCTNGIVKYHGHFFERGALARGVRKIVFDGRHNLIAYSDKQVFVKEPSGIHEIFIENNFGHDFRITALLVDKENIIWIGTTDGMLKLTPTNVYYFNFNAPDVETSEEKNPPRLILVDSRGRKWVYEKGVYTVTGVDTLSFGKEISGEYTSIIEDDQQKIWLATRDETPNQKGGLWKFENHRPHRADVYQNGKVLKTVIINPESFFYRDIHKRIWIPCRSGMIRIEGGKAETVPIDTAKTRFDQYSTLTEDNKGNLFLINHRNVFRYDERSRTFESYFKSTNIPESKITIVFDRFNHAWFADYRGMLIHWDGEEEHIYSFRELGVTGNFTLVGYILPTLFVADGNGDIWLGTSTCGLYQIIVDEHKEKPEVRHFNTSNGLSGSIINDGCIDHAGNLWVLTNYGLNNLDIREYHKTGKAFFHHIGISEGLHDLNCNNLDIDALGNIWLDAGAGEYYKIDLGLKLKDILEPRTIITELTFKNKDKEITLDSLPLNLVLKHTQNSLSFSFIGISHPYPNKVRYKYMLEGLDHTWQKETHRSFVSYSNLPAGHYTFKVLSCNADGVWNTNPTTFSFDVLGPWYLAWYSILTYIILGLGLFFGYSSMRTKALRARQKELEEQVNERTAEIVKQKQIIEVKNHEITDSINYAQRIQRAILPPLGEISQALPGSFILFKPKDIVSGDFYWFGEKGGRTYIATADCTGHGVPGGFMSMIGTEKLKEALGNSADVAEMLSLVNLNLKRALRQSGKENSTRDGMDIALCSFNAGMTEMEYAGANRPLWLIRASNRTELVEYKATKVAIGGLTPDEQVFARHRIELSKGDVVYLCSDGYADQFGKLDKKMMTRKFKEILLSIQNKPMDEQKVFLDNAFEEWRSGMEQTDDVLVIGIRC